MTLFHELAKDPEFVAKRVLILDKDEKCENDRTWSFWSKDKNDFLQLARKSWKKGVFYAPNQSKIDLDLTDYSYYTIEGKDFYKFILDEVSGFKNVSFVHSNIVKVQSDGVVSTTDAQFQGEVVFNSYFVKSDFNPEKSRYFLWQHFYGYVIKTKDARFNPDEFTLMDYRFTDEKRTNFFYILPYADNCALIEFTEFSNHNYSEETYRAMLVDYIENKLGILEYEIDHQEFNAIPMTDFQIDMAVSSHVVNIGSMAGYVKPSSGYAFTRTIQRNSELAEYIRTGNKLEKVDLQSTNIYKAFDNSILYLIQHEKVHGGLIFASLFQKLSADFVFQFLDEKASKTGLLRIMLSSPRKIEFIKYFLKHRGR